MAPMYSTIFPSCEFTLARSEQKWTQLREIAANKVKWFFVLSAAPRCSYGRWFFDKSRESIVEKSRIFYLKRLLCRGYIQFSFSSFWWYTSKSQRQPNTMEIMMSSLWLTLCTSPAAILQWVPFSDSCYPVVVLHNDIIIFPLIPFL